MSELDSTKAFEDIWYGWTITGANPPERQQTIYNVYTVFVTIAAVILGPSQLIIETFFVDNFATLMMQISTSLEVLCIALKTICLYIFRDTLLEAEKFLAKLDKFAAENPADRHRMDQVVRNSIRLYFWTRNVYMTNVLLYVLHGAATGNTIFEGWFPFDWRSSTALYIIAFSYQIFFASYLAFMVAGCDVYMILCIYIFLGHTNCLARRISNIGFATGRVHSSEENYQELVRCIVYHQNTQLYLSCLSSLISGTFLIQFMVTAFVISSTSICAVVLSEDIPFVVKSLLYTVTVMLQVLPCCYLVSEMTFESSSLTSAIYSCNWMDQDAKFRKTLIIFMQRSQQENVILAGNMFEVSLPTFVRLIKMSYSLFTLFSSG